MKNESQLLYHVQQRLKAQGYEVVKKLMWKDGHLVSQTQHYLRETSGAWAIFDSLYAIFNSAEDYNASGSLSLSVAH